ncbi:RDD family protein [Pseudoneobacillus sp. C159]
MENIVEQESNQIDLHRDETPASPIHFAGFWMRFWAYLLDLIVIGSIDRIMIKPVFRVFDIPIVGNELFAPITIATAITFYAYFVFMTKFFRQTLGKMVFGLKVVGLKEEKLSWKTILFREWIGRFISTTIMISYVIVAFLPKKQGLHDLFSDTSVVHEV